MVWIDHNRTYISLAFLYSAREIRFNKTALWQLRGAGTVIVQHKVAQYNPVAGGWGGQR